MERQNHCKQCDQKIWDGLLFCPNCWGKLFSRDDLEKNERIWTARTEQELHAHSMKAKFANVHHYLLVEGNISSEVSATFKTRVKQANKWKEEIAKGTIVVTKAAVGELISQTAKNSDQMQGFSEGNGRVWYKDFSTYVSLFTATTSAGQDALNSLRQGENAYNFLPYADDCTALYEAGFKMVGGLSDYIVFRREQKMVEDIMGIGDSVGNTLSNTLKDFRSILDDFNGGIKKGISWFKSR